MSQPLFLPLFLSLILALGFAFPAPAGSLPMTADGMTLLAPEETLSNPFLVYLMPQMSPLFERQMMGSTSTSTHTAAGVMLDLGRNQRLLLLSQPDRILRYGDYLYISRDFGSVQVGWGGLVSGLRLGLAARVVSEKTWSDDESHSTHSPGAVDYDRVESRREVLEADLGFGIGGMDRSLDVTGTLRWERDDGGTGRLYQYGPRDEGNVFFSHADQKPIVSILARGRLPLGEDAAATVFGSWGGRAIGYEYYLLSYDSSAYWDSSGTLRPYKDNWAVGITVEIPTPHVDRMLASASYRSSRDLTMRNYMSSAELSQTADRSGALTLSLEKDVYKSLSARVGVGAAFDYQRQSDLELQRNGGLRRDKEKVEGLEEVLAWGLGYSWKRFRFSASLAKTPQISDPFTHIDVHYLF
jgi:hypothetical protein